MSTLAYSLSSYVAYSIAYIGYVILREAVVFSQTTTGGLTSTAEVWVGGEKRKGGGDGDGTRLRLYSQLDSAIELSGREGGRQRVREIA